MSSPRRLTDEQRKENNKAARLKWYNKPGTKEKLAKYITAKRKRDPELRMLHCARYRAKAKGLEFNIQESDIIIPEVCPILQTPLVLNNATLRGNSPTLDRIDSSKGYLPGNVRVISHKANSCKSDMSIESVARMLSYMKGEI